MIEVERRVQRCEKGCGVGGGRLCVCEGKKRSRERTACSCGTMGKVAVVVAGREGERWVGGWKVGGCGRGRHEDWCWRREYVVERRWSGKGKKEPERG